jgi:hypothetical protein
MSPPLAREHSRPSGGARLMDEKRDAISRRRMLKRLGAGTAVAWSVPILMSIKSPAFAQASPSCDVFSCIEQQRCGSTPGCPALPPGCDTGGCAVLNGGGCICSDSAFCSDPACSSDADCEAQFGPGYRCAPVNADCGCPGNTGCFLPCGQRARAPRRGQRSLIKA